MVSTVFVLSLAMFYAWAILFPTACGFAQAECPVNDTVAFTDNIQIQGETDFAMTLDGVPTANGTYTIPDSAGNDTFSLLDTAGTRTTDLTFNDSVNATFGTGGDADIDYNGTHLVVNPQVAGSGSVIPGADDGGGLGISGTAWADVFLASGSVINLNAGDVTLTHASNTLTMAGGDLQMDGDIDFVGAQSITTTAGALTINPASDTLFANSSGVVIGHTAQVQAAGRIASEFQVLGTALADSSMILARFSADASAPLFVGMKGRDAIGTFTTVVVDGDDLLIIRAEGSDGTGPIRAAQILFEVDGTPGTNDMPGRLVFGTTADGASSPTERMRITADGGMFMAGATGGSQGTGTINAVQLFDDGVGVSDWVFDLAYAGEPILNDPYYDGQSLYTLAELQDFTVSNRHLPWMPGRDTFSSNRSVGTILTGIWQGQEQQQLYIFELEERIERLEALLLEEVD